jgi:hypothetical protein
MSEPMQSYIPISVMLGFILTLFTASLIGMYIIINGGVWGRVALFVGAWIAVYILYKMGI